MNGYYLRIYEKLWRLHRMHILSVCEELFFDKEEKFKDSALKLIEHLINKINEITNPFENSNDIIKKEKGSLIKNELYDLLTHTISLYSLRQEAPISITEKTWEHILEFQDPKMRYRLAAAIAEMDENQTTTYAKVVNQKDSGYLALSAILLSKLIKNYELWDDLLPKVQNRLFKDYTYQRPLIKTLNALNQCSELTEEDIISLLMGAIEPKNKKMTRSNLLSIQAIINLDGEKELKKEAFEKNNRNFSTIYQSCFRKRIPIKEMEDFYDKFSVTFETYRSNESLLVYAGTLNKYSDNNKALATLAIYVESVLNGTFNKDRYSNSIHLNTVFKNREELKEAWIKGAKESFNMSNNESTDQETIDYKKIFTDNIIKDKHLDVSKYPYLQQYLTASDKDKISIEETIKKEIEDKQQEIKTSNKDELKNKGRILKFLQLQKEIIGLINGQQGDEQLKTLKKIDEECEFNHDIEGLIKSFDVKSVDTELTLVDTDDPWDLFLCGTEVAGSCQRVDGDEKLNIGLLGYLLDGKNRLVAIKDSTGKIIARRILRILWDVNGKKPVLMMERIYPQVLPKKQQEALDCFVKQRAKDLSLELYEEGNIDQVNLESKGGKSPWEYVDSAGGIKSDGVYSINKAIHIK